MKNLKVFFAVLLALTAIFSLCACSIELGGEETWEYSADDKEGTVQLFNNFFEKTFANTNQVITVKSGENVIFVENIDGTSDYAAYETTGSKTYSFIKDGEYIYAMTSEDSNFYMVGETNYGYGYFAYRRNIDVLKDIPEEGVTFACEVKGSAEGENSSAAMTVTVKNGDEGTIKIVATSKNDLVDSITTTRTEDGQDHVSTFSIVYGSASVEIPDISGWTKQDS